MNVWLFLVVLSLLAGIIVLSGKSPHTRKTRKQFLQELADFLEGTLEPITDEAYTNSFRIRFSYFDEQFVFEDVEKQGFKDKVYTAYLKVKTPTQLTLTFSEKKRSTKIRTDIFIASEVSTDEIGRHIQLDVPEHLKDLNISTNDKVLANKLFEDKKITTLLRQSRNIDSRGYPFLAIAIVKGVVALEFYTERSFHPSLSTLKADVAAIEDYLDKLIVFVRKLKEES